MNDLVLGDLNVIIVEVILKFCMYIENLVK